MNKLILIPNWYKRSTVQGRETISFVAQEIKDQVNTRPKIDLETSGGIILDHLGRVGFLIVIYSLLQCAS